VTYMQIEENVGDSPYAWVQTGATDDCYGLLIPGHDATNTDASFSRSSSARMGTSVDRTIAHAITHYEDLLRRLAD